MTISITATDIERSPNPPISGVGIQLRMGGGNFIYFTPEIARQWIGVLETIAKDSK